MMAVYDLEEQEQLDELKAWWKRYGSIVLMVVTVAALAVSGVFGWRAYGDRQALEAGELYVQLQGAVGSSEPKKVLDIASVLADKYPRTGYAQFGALAAARAAFDSGNMAEARSRLQWVLERARDDATRDLARLRLANVLIDEKKYDEALTTLQAPPVASMAALFADLRGDALAAQGKGVDARGAYQQALDKSDAKSPYRGVIQGKLDAMGEAK
jgi:predicted negative regulator of RcsB-dependent stress response